MITRVNPLGSVRLTNDYFAGLVSEAAQNCYGVAAMTSSGTEDDIKSFILRDNHRDKGVRVTEENGLLNLELHIQVGYGLNIQTIVSSITHRVRHTVEKSTGLKVGRIDVYVDDILADD